MRVCDKRFDEGWMQENGENEKEAHKNVWKAYMEYELSTNPLR